MEVARWSELGELHVGAELSQEALDRLIENCKKKGIILNCPRSNSFASVKVAKPAESNLSLYSIEYECQYAGKNKNPQGPIGVKYGIFLNTEANGTCFVIDRILN